MSAPGEKRPPPGEQDLCSMVRDLHTYVCGSNGLMERVKAMELMLSELQGFKYRVIGIAIGVSTVVSLGWQLLKK